MLFYCYDLGFFLAKYSAKLFSFVACDDGKYGLVIWVSSGLEGQLLQRRYVRFFFKMITISCTLYRMLRHDQKGVYESVFFGLFQFALRYASLF